MRLTPLSAQVLGLDLKSPETILKFAISIVLGYPAPRSMSFGQWTWISGIFA
jgi:hypothetical protein